jgi:hypothetical protein
MTALIMTLRAWCYFDVCIEDSACLLNGCWSPVIVVSFIKQICSHDQGFLFSTIKISRKTAFATHQ